MFHSVQSANERKLPVNGYPVRRPNAVVGPRCYRPRHFHPALGKFVSRDPLGYGAGDASMYRYVENRVTVATDPVGLFTVSFVGTGPQVSFDPTKPYGAGAYAAIWLDLTAAERAQLTNSAGGFLIETNYLRYTIMDPNDKVIDSGARKLRFLMYYVMNDGVLEAHHTHRQGGQNDRQYKQLLNWQWGSGRNKFPLTQLQGTKGKIQLTSTFELYPRGATEAHVARFRHSHDPVGTGRTPTVGQAASGFTGDLIDEVGYISSVFPWRKSASRKPISKSVVRIEITWDWCDATPEYKVRSWVTPGGAIAAGQNRTSNRSTIIPPRPAWDL